MNNPFYNISENNKEKILKFLEATTINYKKNTNILTTIKDDNILGIIINGVIQIIRTDYNGNKIIVEELKENDLIGTTISPIYSNEYNIVTKEDTKIVIIEYERIFKNNLNNNKYYNQFVTNLLRITTEQINDKNQRIQILTKKTIRDKLLEYFNFSSHGSKYVYLPFNFIDLANYLAIDRSAMSREIKNLKDEGFIEVKGKKITLLFK